MNLKNVLRFYRILGWKDKMTGMGALGYTVLGYAVAGVFHFSTLFLNALAIFFGILFAFSINNYYDWKLQKERNFLGEKIEGGKISPKKALTLCFLPLILGLFIIIFLFFKKLIGPSPLFFYFALSFLTLFYAQPPLRLKKRKFIGFIAVPLGGFLIFLQGYFIFGILTFIFLLLAILIFLFEIYLEVLHSLEDSLVLEETKKISPQKALKLLKIFPLGSLLFSLAFSFYSPIFLNTSFFSLLRVFSLRNFKIEDIRKIRRNVFSLQLSFYELAIYGAFGVFDLI